MSLTFLKDVGLISDEYLRVSCWSECGLGAGFFELSPRSLSCLVVATIGLAGRLPFAEFGPERKIVWKKAISYLIEHVSTMLSEVVQDRPLGKSHG